MDFPMRNARQERASNRSSIVWRTSECEAETAGPHAQGVGAMSPAAIVEHGRALAKALRDAGRSDLGITVAEALIKGGYDDATIVRLYAQGLVDSGHAEKAVPVLTALADKLSRDSFEF